MASTLILLCVGWFGLAAAGSAPHYNLEDAHHHFENFMQQHDKVYASEHEKQARFEIFKDNLVKYNKQNAESTHAVFGITMFSDLTSEEFHNTYGCLKHHESNDECATLTDADIKYNDAPESFDWRDHNAVSPVKNQGQCGSCYAFSAIGNIEGQYAIKHKELVDLSAQQIVDCDKANDGCNGGLMHRVFRSLINEGGSETEADYPYHAVLGNCQFDGGKVKVKLSNCNTYDLKSQEKLKQLLYHNGPLAIGIQADGVQGYNGGIISDEHCSQGSLNHGVLLVGYGTENGTPYWIVKNSWKPVWGEQGYFRMQRGEGAHSCGMMNEYMSSSVIA